MKLLDLYYINKTLKNSIHFINPVVNKITIDIPRKISNFEIQIKNKKDVTNVLNTIIIFLASKFYGISSLVDITAVDFLRTLKSYNSLNHNRFLLKYTFLNINEQSFINFYIPLISEKFFSLEKILPASIWLQREIWDMYGIIFQGASDHRRILTDYGFKSFPLRTDFPVFGNLEIYYDIEMSELLYKKIDAVQENRFFGYNKTNFWF